MTVDTMARLFELKNIAGVKDATGDLKRLDQNSFVWLDNFTIKNLCSGKRNTTTRSGVSSVIDGKNCATR